MTHRLLPLAAALTACALLAGCEHDPRPKERPHDVPLAAVWAGNADGGAYFDCSTGGQVNQCQVWNDTTGVMSVSGRFVLENVNRAATTKELKYVRTDGKRIFLEDGLTLKPAP